MHPSGVQAQIVLLAPMYVSLLCPYSSGWAGAWTSSPTFHSVKNGARGSSLFLCRKQGFENIAGPETPVKKICPCRCFCFLHIENHPGLSIQHLFLSQPLHTNLTLDAANSVVTGKHTLERFTEIKQTPRFSRAIKYNKTKESETINLEPSAPLHALHTRGEKQKKYSYTSRT